MANSLLNEFGGTRRMLPVIAINVSLVVFGQVCLLFSIYVKCAVCVQWSFHFAARIDAEGEFVTELIRIRQH